MHGLFNSLADKAQSALNSTPLGRQGTSEGGAAGQSGSSSNPLKSHAFENISHSLRSIQQQYSSSVTPVQKIVTARKGVALDLDSFSRDNHASSKETYMWGQREHEDIKDVTDRLAWMTYIEGSLASTLAKEIDASRGPWKALQDDEPLEKEVELLKRKAIKESERMKWLAIREFSEKLTLISQAALAALPALPDVPSSKLQPYTGATLTASIRTTLQQSLDHWQPGDTTLLLREPTAADLSRSDTRSFGETHARELARINTADPHAKSSIPVTPPATLDHLPQAPRTTPTARRPRLPCTRRHRSGLPSPRIISPPAVAAPNPAEPTATVPIITPTVAETGVPKSAGPDGPGPASGSLKDLKKPSLGATAAAVAGPSSSITTTTTSAPKFESAEEEKARLAREDRDRVLATGGSVPGMERKHESAEEEKKRLEREERERVLAAGGSSNVYPDEKKDPEGDGDLPPYQEFSGV
ncbi:uncharacterized protein BXZ73DRAFT_87047 [Epithele typhae]|uniref:uncharacterized protein n=1 Tax=Epithele typhae TaxID=378194 RepID=UPI0020084228|nr:uncharacterized protein BXZ73DRAFT_87047 [Epithele typhae]KAH9944085.1 hypothetical protein BXZ73DRAFT_87047 [Epithele typhae]